MATGTDSKIYDTDKLKELVKGVKTTSELRKKIEEVLKKDGYFKKRCDSSTTPIENILCALRHRKLLKDIKKTIKIDTDWTEGKRLQFKKDYSEGKMPIEEITKKYGLENDVQTYSMARTLRLMRIRRENKREYISERKKIEKSSGQVSEKKVNIRIKELIRKNILLSKNGLEKLWRKIFKEFPKNRPNKKSFAKRISKIIWDQKEIDKTLQEIISDVSPGVLADPVKEFRRIYPFIPLKIVERRAKWHSGFIGGIAKKLMGKDLPGIGRIDLSGAKRDFKMPKTSFDKPVEIEVNDPNNFSLFFLNGADLGVKYPKNIVGSVSRKSLSEANERKDDVVFLTNIICLELKKAGGPAKALRAQVFGDNVKLDLIRDPDYRAIAKRILNDLPMDEVIYRTPEEVFNDIVGGGWNKICIKPNRRPEYTGKIYIILGINERAVIASLTYSEVRWHTLKKQEELMSGIKIARLARDAALIRLKLAGEIKNKAIKKAAIAKERANYKKEDKKLDSLNHQSDRTRITNVANQEFQRYFSYATQVVIEKIEMAIPNSKVIGQSTSFVKIGDKIGEINIPSHLRVTDGLLHDWTRRYAPKVLRGKIADFAVICHPWALQPRMTAREADKDGKRRSMKVFVAPTAINDEFMRSKIDPTFVNDHPLIKAIYTETFKSGVLRVRCINGMINSDEISIGALESFKNYPIIRRDPSTYSRGPKNIWIISCGDHHLGGRSRSSIYDKRTRMRLGVSEAVFEMMRRERLCEGTNMPVHIYASPDDQAHGQNIDYKNRPHPHQMPYQMIERLMGEFWMEAQRAKSKKNILAAAEKIHNLSLYQFDKRGSDYLLEQMMQVMERHIEPNLDIFSAILRRAQNSNLIVKGVGDIVVPEYGGYDSRNIGVINIGSGSSHFAKTVNLALVEGPIYAQKLRDLLGGTEEWMNHKDLLKRLIASPIYASTSIGWGTISIKGKYEYGFEMRESPAKQGWPDPLREHVNRDLQRGNYSLIFNEKIPVVKISGHKHFLESVSTSYALYHLAPPAVHTDEYGEVGLFPPNNTGVSFIGIPADGPDSGPILWRSLLFDQIKYFIENDVRFDWDSFLPNPA